MLRSFFQSDGKCMLSWWQVDVCMADGGLARYGLVDPCRNPMENVIVVVWRMEKWQRLTVGPQREMVDGVLLVFFLFF